jgi:hypothetical protein
MEKYEVDFGNGNVVEFSGQPTPADIEEVAKSLSIKPVESLVPNIDRRESSIMENIFNIPSAAVRSFLQGTGYEYGAQNFRHIPTFQEKAIDKANENLDKMGMEGVPVAGPGVPQFGVSGPNSLRPPDQTAMRFALTLPASAAGFALDVATSPADAMALLAGKTPVGKGKDLGQVFSEFPAVRKAGEVMNYPLENIPRDIKKGVMSLATKDPELAASFATNPDKYNISPFKGAPTVEKIQREKVSYMQNLREDVRRRMEDLTETNRINIDDLKYQFDLNRQELMRGEPQAIQAASRAVDESLAKVQASMQDRLMETYTGTLKIVDGMYDNAGQAVDRAIAGILDKNPEATLPHRMIFEPFKAAFDDAAKNSKIPFEIKMDSGALEIGPKTGVTDPKDVELFARLWKDMNLENPTAGYRIDTLQTLKGQLQEISSQYYNAGKGRLGKFYQELSKIVNPANAISKNPEISDALPNLKSANAEYAAFKPRYEEMLGFYTKPDANGRPVPDFRKVMNAVESNDVATLNRIREAENALPEADRILPKVQEALKDMKIAKRMAQDELLKTRTQIDLQLQELTNSQKQILSAERGEARQQKLELARQSRELLVNEQRKIDAHLDFIQDQEALRKIPGMVAGNILNLADKLASPVKGPAKSVAGIVEGLSSAIKQAPGAAKAVGVGAFDAVTRQGK